MEHLYTCEQHKVLVSQPVLLYLQGKNVNMYTMVDNFELTKEQFEFLVNTGLQIVHSVKLLKESSNMVEIIEKIIFEMVEVQKKPLAKIQVSKNSISDLRSELSKKYNQPAPDNSALLVHNVAIEEIDNVNESTLTIQCVFETV